MGWYAKKGNELQQYKHWKIWKISNIIPIKISCRRICVVGSYFYKVQNQTNLWYLCLGGDVRACRYTHNITDIWKGIMNSRYMADIWGEWVRTCGKREILIYPCVTQKVQWSDQTPRNHTSWPNHEFNSWLRECRQNSSWDKTFLPCTYPKLADASPEVPSLSCRGHFALRVRGPMFECHMQSTVWKQKAFGVGTLGFP